MNTINQFKGSKKILPVEITKTVSGVTSPFDLTGYTAYLTVKACFDEDEPIIFQKTVTDHLDAVNGKTEFVVEASDTASQEVGTYVFDIQIVKDTDIFTVITGEWNMNEVVKN